MGRIQIQTEQRKQTHIKMQYAITQNGVPMGIGEGVSAKFPIEKDHVGFMIGKRGGNVKRIRDKLHVQILIQDDKTDKPWFLVRALFQKNLDAACVELVMLGNRMPPAYAPCDYKYELPAKDSYQKCEIKTSFLIVDQAHVGSLIGPNGSFVKQVARECGAFVYIQQGSEATGGRPWFQIKGLYTQNIETAYATLANKAMELCQKPQVEMVDGPSA
jgi:hypothetical protein